MLRFAAFLSRARSCHEFSMNSAVLDFCAVIMMRSAPSSRRLTLALIAAIIAVGLLTTITYHNTGLRLGHGSVEGSRVASEGSTAISILHRKLLRRATDDQEEQEVKPSRIWGDRKCSTSDIVINQGPTSPLPSGIPTYTVEIMNVCVTGCDISGIHLSCGWFSSARLINPRVFKRLRYNDCLVNAGRPLVNGRTVSFQYANTFRYPLSVSSVIC
ncbi:hypothetical protein RHSIM_Rhsim08G0193300 [Rhododendron simsii]|uniref:Protein TAPETUM DETERMINANT 1 n=1 Tax=Rhododendron simsii TaxID=118357 RepID=A0A834LH34_RHOSS|nr:hypothetical protein RHSIM_Rhsim08G0193300 [Rhododendron simsii]